MVSALLTSKSFEVTIKGILYHLCWSDSESSHNMLHLFTLARKENFRALRKINESFQVNFNCHFDLFQNKIELFAMC